MKILLTGGAGFVGHHVVDFFLRNTDAEFVVLDRLDTSGNLNRLHEVIGEDKNKKNRIKFLWHDLKSPINDFLIKEIGNVEYVFHLAAGSHVDRSIENPMEFVFDNVVATGHILEFARLYLKNTLKMFLYFSTDEVFGPAPEGVFYKENDRYNSGNPYSATKAGGEELAIAYENTYKMPIVVTHTMNVFGIRQHPEKFIPRVIRSVLSGNKIYIHADKTRTKSGTRHYINTEDVADAILFLTKNFVPGEKYNIVGKQETSNLELAQIVAKILDKPLNYELVDFHSSRPGHDLRYALCGEKMKEMGWVPRKELEERMKEVIKWSIENNRWL
jgi:dTDP-glucose 4,6-dehydratase